MSSNMSMYEDEEFEIKVDKRGRKYKKNLATGKTTYKIDLVESEKPVKPIPKKRGGRKPAKAKAVEIVEPVEPVEPVEQEQEQEIKKESVPKKRVRKAKTVKPVEPVEPVESDSESDSDSDIEIVKKSRGRPKGSKNRSQPIIIKIDNSKKTKKKRPDNQLKYKGSVLDKNITMTHSKELTMSDQKFADYVQQMFNMSKGNETDSESD